MNMLMVDQRPVRLLKGGGIILKGDKEIGQTEKDESWIAHSVFWEDGGTPMLWMIHVMNPEVGAWAELKDVTVDSWERGPGQSRQFRAYY